jgi:predicted GH43/DUF377 family glycosyl hydrolase
MTGGNVGQDGILRGGWQPPPACQGRAQGAPPIGRSLQSYPTILLLVLLALSGCSRYADFSLPPVSGGDPTMTFAFEAQVEPVLTPGVDAWESHDVLNPSVISRPGPQSLLSFYSGFDGRTWRTGLAASDDGTHWQKQGVILSPDPRTWEGSYIAANGSALWYENQFWYWYQAGPREKPRIGLARAVDTASEPRPLGSDGHTSFVTGPTSWRKEPSPVLDPGPYESWDECAVADPYVIRIEPYFYLFYLGQDRARRQRLGVARSTDGVRWEKLRANPILELGDPGAFDENGLGEPAVWHSHGFYWMLYTGRDTTETRRLGLARSTDGVHWRKLPVVFAGSQPWDAKVICDPTVEVAAGVIRVWFGGGDVASPDENLHGQIGMAILRPVRTTR